jgi:chemotaxis protein methyltransferase CheR
LVRVWVAGCATGEEVYSLAILLQEEGLYERCRIYATDISDDLLQQASKGEFPLERMKLYTQNYLRAGGKQEFSSYYRAHGDVATFDPSLKTGLVFSQHNLAVDRAFNEFQLVLCRNVMIYFNDTLRHRVHSLLFESLGNFGVLGLGLKESIRFTPHAGSFVDLNAELRLYKKIG